MGVLSQNILLDDLNDFEVRDEVDASPLREHGAKLFLHEELISFGGLDRVRLLPVQGGQDQQELF